MKCFRYFDTSTCSQNKDFQYINIWNSHLWHIDLFKVIKVFMINSMYWSNERYTSFYLNLRLFFYISKCQSSGKVGNYCVSFNATLALRQVDEMLDTFRYFDTLIYSKNKVFYPRFKNVSKNKVTKAMPFFCKLSIIYLTCEVI